MLTDPCRCGTGGGTFGLLVRTLPGGGAGGWTPGGSAGGGYAGGPPTGVTVPGSGLTGICIVAMSNSVLTSPLSLSASASNSGSSCVVASGSGAVVTCTSRLGGGFGSWNFLSEPAAT